MKENFSNASEEEILNFYKKISSNIRKLREEKGISQLELALDIGIKSVAFYSNCECNRYNKHFNLEHLYKISKSLKIPIKDLLE
ncbi:helix-turn-helix transcriptional regulator [Campylobacter sp. TTU-622]|uniref:helix-turn-helix domain-containing protein n=1 Tax=unclassified Campylobacter TaxID=2593542 RepID=UPI0019046D26|nr:MULTISPECIES: helix-turn-helix transcriptional regulator [unclassified Campylobacter]MBK1972484.1 helix-turn-helix transcriptional regulator [Campylobacter sp. TTU-622]MBK1991078.1 helix-turn-helix transcriptional regulator [Campylobacter sp. 2018MI34]